jgi:hypothetical protein
LSYIPGIRDYFPKGFYRNGALHEFVLLAGQLISFFVINKGIVGSEQMVDRYQHNTTNAEHDRHGPTIRHA